MKIHHLNCGTMRPAGGVPGWGAEEAVCHCLLVETGTSLVLVDTGIGMADIADPSTTLEDWFLTSFRPALDPQETAVHQVRALGRRPEAVTDIVLTHPDRDHAGGITDFPWARIHLAPAARAAVRGALADPDTAAGRGRVRGAQWPADVLWGAPPRDAARWYGFATWTLPEVPGVVLVDLPGHSAGHVGVALSTGAGSLLHAGDAYFHRAQVSGGTVPTGVGAFTESTEQDRPARIRTQDLLARLAKRSDVVLTCAHDLSEFRSLARR